MAKRQVDLGMKGGPFAFIIPPDQFDAHATRKLEQLLIDGDVEVRRTLEPFRVAETVYSEGADLILMAQPNRAYAKTLLEVQEYPARTAGPVDRPYDVTGWTLPLQMNVRVDRINQYFEPPPTTRIDRATIAPAKVWGDVRKPSFFVIDGRGNGASIAINRLLKSGARVSFLTSALPILGYTYQPGAILVMDGKGVRESVETIARDFGLRATASSGRPPTDARPLGRARVGLYRPATGSIDEGWTRWLLEQYEFEFETIVDADIRRGGLRPRFDAIVLPDQDAERIMAGNAAGTMPPEYVGGIGTDGAEALKQFVAGGGTLIALDSASELAASLVGATLSDATRGLSPDQYLCPGSIVRIDLETDPLTYGMPRETAGFCALSGAFDIAAGPDGTASSTVRMVARYAKSNVLASGWLQGERVIAGKGAMAEVKSGQGRAILFAFRPQHRAQSHATFRLLFNAIHTSK
jgi:hypothetical protein